MRPFHHRAIRLTVLFLVTLVLQACGGSASSPSGNTDLLASQAYTGNRTQTAIDENSAENLAMGSYVGGQIGVNLGRNATGTDPGPNLHQDAVFKIAQSLKNVIRQFQAQSFPPSGQPETAPSSAVARTTYVDTLYGQCGGSAIRTSDADETTGEISGSIIFNSYCDNNQTLSGKVTFSGLYDQYQGTTSYSQNFTGLSFSTPSISLLLTGNLSWTLASNLSETTNLEMCLLDRSTNETYWLNNYHFTTTYSVDSMSQQISGRYYDYHYGYVDFETSSPLVTFAGYAWPAAGSLQFSGQQGGRIELNFDATSLSISIDMTGDGNWEWNTNFETNSTPPPEVNQAPIANAGPDQDVEQGALVILDGSASVDPDDDPLTYYWSFTSCPSYGCSSLSSYNDVNPSFRPQEVGTYVLELRVYDGYYASSVDSVSIRVQPVSQQNPTFLSEEWKFGLYGTNIGAHGLNVLDLDNDDLIEIVTDGGNSWYIVKNSGTDQYEQIYSSMPTNSPIARVIAATPAGRDRVKIFIALQDGTIEAYDGQTHARELSAQLGSNIIDMEIADIDRDDQSELVLTDGVKTYVYSADDLLAEFVLDNYGGTDLALGNVDEDPAMEIVIAADSYNNSHGYVIDAESKTLEWDYLNGFGSKVMAGDIDADGIDEIVAMADWYTITVLNAEVKTPAWEITTSANDTLALADTNDDGVPEVLYGDGQWGGIHCIDGQTKEELWHIDNPGYNLTNIGFGDVDQDGSNEVLWGTSLYGSSLVIADPAENTTEWQSPSLDGPLSAVDVGDVDDDGSDEIIMISYESNGGYDEGIIHIFDAATHQLEWTGALGLQDWMGVRTVKIGDVDNDGQTEFVVSTANIYDGVIRVYDGATHTFEATSSGYNGLFFTDLEIADVDGDGQSEIIAGTGKEHTGATGIYLLVLDGATLAEEWRSTSLTTGWGMVTDIETGDVDDDGNLEILCSVGSLYPYSANSNKIYVYDGVSHQLDWLAEIPATALTTADLENDGNIEILFGKTDGSIDIYSGVDYSFLSTVSPPVFGSINSLKVSDLDNDGIPEWLIGAAGLLSVLSGPDQSLLWQSDYLGEEPGKYNHLIARDIDNDGRAEVVFGTAVKLFQFEVTPFMVSSNTSSSANLIVTSVDAQIPLPPN